MQILPQFFILFCNYLSAKCAFFVTFCKFQTQTYLTPSISKTYITFHPKKRDTGHERRAELTRRLCGGKKCKTNPILQIPKLRNTIYAIRKNANSAGLNQRATRDKRRETNNMQNEPNCNWRHTQYDIRNTRLFMQNKPNISSTHSPIHSFAFLFKTNPIWWGTPISTYITTTYVEPKAQQEGGEKRNGEEGIRTLGRDKPYTAFPRLLLKPLGHLSVLVDIR